MTMSVILRYATDPFCALCLIRHLSVVPCTQLGSWVPASSCTLSVFDRVCCRMGASDSLMLGRSTFAEELGEASHILAHATNRCVCLCVCVC